MQVGITLIIMLLLMAFSLPVAFSLCLSGSVGLIISNGFNSFFHLVGTIAHTEVANFSLTTIPMFILMAEIASRGNLAKQLFTLANRSIGHLPGGVAIATVLASAGFGAMCGTSSAAAATMSNIAVPEMRKIGYTPKVATGVVAISGTLAIMIPPSVPMIIYGLTTETSIGKLLIAGILPGILTAIMHSAGIFVWSKISPESIPKGSRYTWKQRLETLKGLLPFIVVVFCVIGGMYSGVATPTEIASLGALVTLIICLAMRSIDLKGIIEAIKKTVLTTTMILTILVGAMTFGYFLTASQAAQKMIMFITSAGLPNWLIMACLIVLYIILGCILDAVAILLITLPLTFPLVTSLGFDGIWFGVIVIKLCEIGLVTPPVGINVYVTSGATGVPLEEVFKGTGVMLCFESIVFILLLLFPAISLFLPSLMK